MIVFVLAAAGLLMIYLEFFIPGGILAILGGGLLVGSLVLFGMQKVGVGWLVIYFLILFILVLSTCKLALWQIRKSRKKKSFYLADDQAGFQASEFKKEFIGKTAIAYSDLKPAGHILVEGEQLQALSETTYIDKGSTVLIIGGKGAYLIVKKTEM